MRFDATAFFGLLIALAGLAFGQLEPEWTAFSVLVATMLLAAIRRAFFHPALFLSIGLLFILLMGGLNISNYRGEVPDEIFGYILQCIMVLSGTAAAVTLFPPAPRTRPPHLPALPYWMLWLALTPAITGVLWIVATVGVPLLNPSIRFRADPKAVFLVETATAIATLMAYRFHINTRFSGKDWLMCALIAVLLLIPGYRNWIVVAILIGLLGLNRMGSLRIRLVPALFFTAAIVVFLAAVSTFRRASSTDLLSSDLSAIKYQIQYLPPVLAQLHFGFRESIALTSQLIERQADFGGQHVFLADVMTMLPGQATSGGRILAEQFGAAQAGGLTPGLIGLLTTEFGQPWCLAGFAIAGALGGAIWLWYARSRAPEVAILYGYHAVDFLLLFHRGILKPSMIVVPLYFLVLVFFMKRLRRGEPKLLLAPDMPIGRQARSTATVRPAARMKQP
jgi:hypothetical protein